MYLTFLFKKCNVLQYASLSVRRLVFIHILIIPAIHTHLFSLGLKCHTYFVLYKLKIRDCRIYLYVRVVRIKIWQYGRRFAAYLDIY